MRLPRFKREQETVDPHRPHEHRQGGNAGIGALAPLGGGVGRQEAALGAAGSYTRTMRCAVPGCGKDREDLIDAPADA